MKTKLSALIITMFAAASAFAAGDIYEIRPCDEYGLNTSAYTTPGMPLGSGTSNIYFNVRLQLRGGGSNPNMYGLRRQFKLDYCNPSAPWQQIYDDVNNPLKIGIYVSGKLRTASLQRLVPNTLSGTNFFDCVFVYKPQPGDFALPVRLAVEDADGKVFPADESDNFAKYHFENDMIWSVNYYDDDDPSRTGPAVWKFTATGDQHPGGKRPNGISGSYTPEEKFSLANAGIYVQTVDFESSDADQWVAPGEYWREVPKGDEIELAIKVDSEVTGAYEDTQFYVWSMDETAVKIVGGETYPVVTNIIAGAEVAMNVQVGTLTIKGGSVSANFTVFGVESNKIANVVLSPWKGFKYSKYIGERLGDYVEIPVKCGPPPVPSVQLSFDKDKPSAPSGKKLPAPVNASTNYNDRATEKIPLYVTLTKESDTPVTVQIKVRYEANEAVDPIAERFVSLSENGDEFSASDIYATNVTFTVEEMARGDLQKTLYIYPLGGNPDTKTQGIGFYPVLPDAAADAAYEKGDRALLQINSLHAPVIMLPKNETDYGVVSGAAGEGFDVSLFMNDCYRDMVNTNGFTVTFGGALKGQPATNIVFTAGESLDLTLTGYDKKKEGQQTGTIKISEPAEPGVTPKTATVQITFTVAVEKDKLVYVDLYNDTSASSRCTETQFAEGAAPIPMFYVNEPLAAGQSIYFFLRPMNAASSNLVSCAAFTQGIELVGGQTNTVRSSAFALNFLDGCADTEVKSLEYEIFARTAATLSEGSESILYSPAQKLVINVLNVNPNIQAVRVNGASDPVANSETAVWKHAVSAQVNVPFQAKLSDPSRNFDVSNGLMTVWCFTEGRTSNQYRYEFARVTNGVDTITVNHEFSSGGVTQDVAVVVLDKDMLKAITGTYTYEPTTQTQMSELWTTLTDQERSYYAKPYRFRVAVGTRPSVIVYFPANEGRDELIIRENARQTEHEGKLGFELSEPAEMDLDVEITVSPLNESGNPGNLELAPAPADPFVPNVYVFRIKANSTEPSKSTIYNGGVNFNYDTMDGTAGSELDGFYIQAKVITPGERGADYFDYGEGWVYIENTPPVITPPTPETPTTNRTVAVNEPFELVWSATDVKKDLNPDDPAQLTCRWYDNGMEMKELATKISTNGEYTTTLTLKSDGDHEIRLVVTDKEGENYHGMADRVWYYYIAPVKKLAVHPYGPLATTKSRYGSASGRGQGRVYADTAKYVVQGFRQEWTYSVMTDYATVSAWGYPSKVGADGNPVAYTDDGTLLPDPSRDLPLMANGNSWASGATVVSADCYELDGVYDNYFYRWVHVGAPGTGGISSNEYQVVEATTSPLQEVTTLVGLDPYVANKSSSYSPRTIEAIFSREHLCADNCGDINNDGIPDLYVGAFRFNVFDENNNMVGSDVDPLKDYNDDGDLLPKSLSDTFEAFIPDLTNNWVSDFRAVDEIRGYGKNLNDANLIPENERVFGLGIKSDLLFTNPLEDEHSTLELVEWVAYTNYCAKMGWEPADDAHWGIRNGSYANSWSPERPTDPTKADTDSDGISDGYEYWVWYKAHVGELRNGELHRITGRRYVPNRPCDPDPIDPDTIASLYDPLVPNPNFATSDTDNDGLPDFIEYVLGTNPFDFDTDHDGLPDGYELYVTHTDPLLYATDKVNPDGSLNPDGDAMAVVIAPKAKVVAYLADGVTNYFAVASEDGFTIEDGKITAVQGTVYTAWRYWGVGVEGPRFCVGREVTDTALYLDKEVAGEQFAVDLLFIHYHVYQLFGFDPRTGWNLPPFLPGHLVDTVEFTHEDEFLALAFYLNAGGGAPATAAWEWNGIWKGYLENSRDIGLVPGAMPDDVLFQLWTLGTTNPLMADTDSDGMPDGWELYIQAGPRNDGVVDALGKDFTATDVFYGPGCMYSPLEDFALIAGTLAADPERDGLDFPHEYSGTESVALYSNKCDTVVLLQPEWQNKIWPTDPWSEDTDNDGITDGAEGEVFIYGTNVQSSAYEMVAGGGLNPLSWDTDADGLPDMFEIEFAGSYLETTTVTITQNADGTVTSNSTFEAGWQGGMDGTANDAELDYDKDGLMNWQEYMVGAMRGWRYDDPVTTWDNHKSAQVDFGGFTDEDWYNFLINPGSDTFCPTFGSERCDPGVYFSCATNRFEQNGVYGSMYMFSDGYYHRLRIEAKTSEDQHNYWTRYRDGMAYVVEGGYPAKYCCCDPRFSDTDGDGMDDYYELFHGMNPILASPGMTGTPGAAPRDIVYESWAASPSGIFSWTATCNWWYGDMVSRWYTIPEYLPLHLKDGSGFDFFQFPWLGGVMDYDFDGDNLRNQQECILANVQAANTYLHTDPSPLWATDIDFVYSIPHRWYRPSDPLYAVSVGAIIVPAPYFEHAGVRYNYADFPWLNFRVVMGIPMIMPDIGIINRWTVEDTLYSVEQNEGYDSDHDYLGDFEEAQGKTKASSDPQQFDDPLRRQAMWFGGKDDPGFLQTPIPRDEIDGDGTVGDLRRDFLYYTVECWAKADEESLGNGLFTLVERATASGVSGPADEKYLRKNFLIGLRNGRWYTKFDSTGTDAKQEVEITDGPVATTNWTHIAATYDGSLLKLYVDGVCCNIHDTQLMPEHGLSAITVTQYGEMNTLQVPWEDLRVYPRWMNSVIVGASAVTIEGVCFDLQWQLRSQGLNPEPPHVDMGYATTIDDYGNFFKGYIDEVRIWDGARKDSEISDDYQALTRYTPELAEAKEQEVLAKWLEGGRLAPIAGASELPAHLRFHWSFDHVPGAVKPEDAITAPAGFQTLGSVVDAKAYWARPLGWTSEWLDWLDPSIQSKVFTDHAWVPWICNTASHLPRVDGTTLDSCYWGEGFAGATPAAQAGYTSFAFKRSAEVFSYWVQAKWIRNEQVYSQGTSTELTGNIGKADEHIFTLRGKMSIGGDLLPFGSAFPKRIDAIAGGMWDKQGAADAWAQSGEDGTHNGLPDWWEEYARENYADLEPGDPFLWDSTVTYNGMSMPAWEAYKRDLARGLLPDGKYHDGKNTPDDFRDTRDNDHDGIADWWEDLYRIDTGSYTDAHADSDNDGLSNYVEYMLSEVFDLKKGGVPLIFDPKNPCSVNKNVSDYFYRLGDLYVGEIFADHDRMSDQWEQKFFDKVSPYLYDAGGDADGDGWSNYAEFQAGTDPTLLGSIGIDEVQINEYPVPTIELSVNYEGNQNVIGAPLMIKAWHDQTLESVPDAVWSVGLVKESTQTMNGNTNNIAGTKYIGMNPNKELLFHLSPGSIVKGSVKFEYKDVNWYLVDLLSGNAWVFDAVTAVWVECLYDREIPGSSGKGEIVDKFSEKVVGSIDYVTGSVVIDLTAVSDYMAVEGDISMSTASGPDQHLVSVYNLDMSYIRVNWNAKPIVGSRSATFYLSDADQPTASLNSLGHVKEGLNTFIAFYDLDGDGKYTAGEPYGTMRGVDVGWNYGKVKIELTDTSAISPRFNTQDATNDREVLYGSESGNYDPMMITSGNVSGGKYERVRVVRTLIDDRDISDLNIPQRVVLDKEIYIDDEQLYVTEADFLKNGGFDLDWETLASDLEGKTEGLPVNSIGYRIVLGSGTIKNTETNNLLGLVFRRMFDVEEVYTDPSQKPVCIGPGIVHSASPTFSWYVPNGLNSYTAFEINIWNGRTLVWNSGYQLIPARVRDDTYGWRYDWTAPIFAGDKLLNGQIFKNDANYQWEVRVTNARFRNIENWSQMAQFRMNVLTESTDYGTIDVAVRHYGPAAIRTSGEIRVQAFTTPDFSGTPVAQGYVTDLTRIASTGAITGGNAKLIGLPAGNYYIRAFVDTLNDGVCQDWETWGYACARDKDSGLIYSPRSVQVGPAIGIYNTVPVYLEDSDTDQDNLPDAWEWAQYGNLTTVGVTSLDERLANGVTVNKSLAGTISAKGAVSGGLSVMTMRALSNPYIAALACGVPVSAGASVDDVTAALVSTAGELDATDTDVRITAVSLDLAKRAVIVDVSGTLVNAENPALSIYTFDGTPGNSYTFELKRKNTLVDATWTKVGEVTFTLGLNEKSLEIPIPAEVEVDSGFFIIELAK